MMRRRTRERDRSGLGPIGAVAQSALALAFGLAVALSPVSMISCAHHGAPSMAAGADQPHAPAAEVVAHGESDDFESDDRDHGAGPCCCLGHCCPGGSTAHPASDAHDVRPDAAVGALALTLDRVVRPTADPWLLP